MGIAPDVIKQKEFTTRFRGFDVQEVDTFLEEIALEVEKQEHEIQRLNEDYHRLELENQGYKKREASLKRVMLHSQKIVEQMKKNAEKSAEMIIARAEVAAEKILNKSHLRLSQLHGDINELKRQRMQIEVQIGSVLESHSKLLEMSQEDSKASDEADSTLKFFKRA